MPNQAGSLVGVLLMRVAAAVMAVMFLFPDLECGGRERPSRQVDVRVTVVFGYQPTAVAPPGAGPLSQQDGWNQE
jgi:hypothetical protein